MKFKTLMRYEDLKPFFTRGFYNYHLEGLCYLFNKLCYFKTDPETLSVDIYSLSWIEKAWWHTNKLVFEILYGTHWSNKKDNSF